MSEEDRGENGASPEKKALVDEGRLAEKNTSRGPFGIWIFVVPILILAAWPALKLFQKASADGIDLSGEDVSAFHHEADGISPPRTLPAVPELEDNAINVRYRSNSPSPRSSRTDRSSARRSDSSSGTTHYGGNRREKAFIRKHDREIWKYQNRLGALGRKYLAKYPALRKMDTEFSKMDRFMALNRQFLEDRNAFNWARGAMALPEVRAALIRYSANPQVVQAIAEVSLEAMKTPPPRAIQREIQHFLTTDPKTSDYVNEVMEQSLGNAMSTMASMPPQTLLPLQKLGSKIMGNNFANTVGSAQPDSYQ